MARCSEDRISDFLFHIQLQVAADNGLDAILTMIATPSLFFNECEVHFQFNWKSFAELPNDVIVQVFMPLLAIAWRAEYSAL